MRRVLAVLVAGLAVAPPASAAERSVLVNGDSLAEGTQPYIPRELPRWRVTHSTSVSRHADDGDDVMRRYASRLPRVIHVSLGTNDDPGDVDGFRDAIADVMKVAGRPRCVRMVRRRPDWLAHDGVHVSATGYRARAEAVARAVERCD